MTAVNKPVPFAEQPSAFSSLSLFQKVFFVGAINVLVASTTWWAILGATIQNSNADQLINAYLFDNSQTFHDSFMPGTHTFLLKWPLFWLIKILGYTDTAYTVVTVGACLATVCALAYVAYRLIRKPLPFAILCLAISAILLPMPTQPYPGALLPVNMAMLTTRNLEYIVYLVGLLLLIKIPGNILKSWRFWLSVGLLGLLIASDKIFLPLTLGGAGVSWLVYYICHNQQLARLCLRWLLAGVAGTILAYLILFGLGKIVHITGDGSASPYGIVGSLRDFALGAIYAITNTFTNLGANPAFDATEASNIPGRFVLHMFSWGFLAYAVNLLLSGLGAFTIYRLIRASFAGKDKTIFDYSTQLPLMLIWTSLAAIAIYIMTTHYYPVDARYLGIVTFTVVLALAIYFRDHTWVTAKLVPISLILIAGIASGVFVAWENYQQSASAMTDTISRNVRIATALQSHAGRSTLLGVHWRVAPIRQLSNSNIPIMPLSSCTQAREVLSSSAWWPDMQNQPFAYLLSYNSQISDFPSCTLQQITEKYGEPNASTIISGTHDKPTETLLFYDRGMHSSPNEAKAASAATVAPASLDQIAKPTCTGRTVFTVVAHEDDDLLFMIPDQLHSLQAGDCLRTIYITSGDAGKNDTYWLGREKGSQKAYDSMSGNSGDVWTEQIIRLGARQYITIATPQNKPNISLVFLRLPDGNMDGSGFAHTKNQSLAKLDSGAIDQITSVDGQATYNKSDIISTINRLMEFYEPSEIRTQAPNSTGKGPQDHSDHQTVARLTQAAQQQYKTQNDSAPLPKYYLGYSIRDLPPNVSGPDYDNKVNAFFAYSKHDSGCCVTVRDCDRSIYGSYLKRQYTYDFGE